MQFNSIKNLGLATLTTLLLGTVLIGLYFNDKTQSMLISMIQDKAPVQEEIFTVNQQLESATQAFYSYIRRNKIYREDVVVPIERMHRIFGQEPQLYRQNDAYNTHLGQHTARLLALFKDLTDSRKRDQQAKALELENRFIETLLTLGNAIELHPELSRDQQDLLNKEILAVESGLIHYLEKQEADLAEVFSILDQVEKNLIQVKPRLTMDSSQVDALLDELSSTRSALKEYQLNSDISLGQLLSLTEAEITVLDAWTNMRDAISGFNAQLRHSIQQSQGQMIEASRQSSELLLLLGCTALLLAVVISLLIGRTLSQRIQQLASGIGNIARGDYDHRIEFKGSDPFASVAKSFDAMAVELKGKEQALYQQANFDSLTGLPNRRKFHKTVNQALERAEANNHKVVMLFIDLDNFKRINDSLGHAVGDALLEDVALRLTGKIRETDVVSLFRQQQEPGLYRLGGDEFVVLLEGLDEPQDAAHIAERIITELTSPTTLCGYDIPVTASIGISVYPTDAQNSDGLIKHADVAMYHAKAAGKNSFQFYCDSMNVRAMRQISLEDKLRRAIDNNDLSLHYQPQMSSDSGQIVSLEALLRWSDEELGAISPVEFIPVAEDAGLIGRLGNWVMEQACVQVALWQRRGLSVRVAINISGEQFKAPNIVQDLCGITKQVGICPSSITLELTESVLMDDSERAVEVMTALRLAGFELSVDDFGTGYSSLSYLKRFPLHELKIDRSFVTDIPDDDDNMAICEAVIAMASKLGLRVVAEGVEHNEQLVALAGTGCQLLQGYHIGRPVPASELDYEAFARTSNSYRLGRA